MAASHPPPGTDPDLPIDDVQRMEQVHAGSIAPARFSALLLSAMAGIALMLTVVGAYGVFAYGVNQRRREIGIRLALGARRAQVLGMIMREAMLVCGVGLAIGLTAALVVSRLRLTTVVPVPDTAARPCGRSCHQAPRVAEAAAGAARPERPVRQQSSKSNSRPLSSTKLVRPVGEMTSGEP